MNADPRVRFWTALRDGLRKYQTTYSIPNLFGLKEKAGVYLCVVLLAWLVLGYVLSVLPYGLPGAAVSRGIVLVLVLWYIADSVLVHTSITFVAPPIEPVDRLRSLVLAMVAFLNVTLGFALLCLLQRYSFTQELGFLRAIYFSITTIATVGYGDISPKPDCPLAQITVIVEILTGLYFLAVVLSVIVSWAPGRDTERGSPQSK